MFLLEAGAFALLTLYGADQAALAIVIIGFSIGSEVDCISYCTARFFGMRSYGEIQGMIWILTGIGLASGPALFSYLQDSSGGYDVPFASMSVLAVAAAVLMALAGRRPFFGDS